MPPSKKKKNRSKRSGQGSGLGQDGGVSGSGVRRDFGEVGGGESGGVGAGVDLDTEIIDIDLHNPMNTPHVEVVYVEEHLKRREDVPSHGLIRQGWLQQCTRDSLQDWGPDLPGVDVGELVGRVVPATARSYNDLAPGKGLVLVEMIDKNKGFVGQLHASRASVLELQDTQSQLLTLLNESRESREDIRTEMRERFDRTEEIHTAELKAMQLEIVKLERCTEELKMELRMCTSDLTAHIGSLSAFVKKGVELSNKVKKRVALTLARNAMEIALGTVKGTTETWSAYFDRVTADDWHRVGVERGLVRSLLADGAHAFNDSIHEIPAEEVVGSIASMPLGSLRSAWEEIFYLAFQKRVTDEVFREELDYAAEQRRVLMS